VSGPSATIMSNNVESIETKFSHETKLVGGQGTEGIVRVIRQALRFRRITVAAEICTDDGETLSELRPTLAHIARFCGKPCSKSVGGPDPPMTQAMSTPNTETLFRSKPSNMCVALGVHDSNLGAQRDGEDHFDAIFAMRGLAIRR